MEGTAYDRLRTYVEELIEKRQQADVDHPGSNPANGSKCTYRRARGNRGANSHTASAMTRAGSVPRWRVRPKIVGSVQSPRHAQTPLTRTLPGPHALRTCVIIPSC
jgi:hypothetical protein